LATTSSSTSSFLGVGPVKTVTVDPQALPPSKPFSSDELYDLLLNDKLPTKKTTDFATTVAAIQQPRSNLLDYLLDTTGQVATPSIRQEFPYQEQQITLTVVASSKADATTAQQLLEIVTNYLEQPQQLL
jgi:hypothetical protein